MAYDDVIRVADLKTRASRFARVRSEVRGAPDQLVYTTEFMHPRMEEVCGTMPAAPRPWLESEPACSGARSHRQSRPPRADRHRSAGSCCSMSLAA